MPWLGIIGARSPRGAVRTGHVASFWVFNHRITGTLLQRQNLTLMNVKVVRACLPSRPNCSSVRLTTGMRFSGCNDHLTSDSNRGKYLGGKNAVWLVFFCKVCYTGPRFAPRIVCPYCTEVCTKVCGGLNRRSKGPINIKTFPTHHLCLFCCTNTSLIHDSASTMGAWISILVWGVVVAQTSRRTARVPKRTAQEPKGNPEPPFTPPSTWTSHRKNPTPCQCSTDPDIKARLMAMDPLADLQPTLQTSRRTAS